MTRRGVAGLALTLVPVAAVGLIVGLFGSRPHPVMAGTAAGLMLGAAVAADVAERSIGRAGGEALVLAYWAGVGVRGVVSVVGAMLLARFGFESQDRQALVFWLLASYLVVLVSETVRSVRSADLARVAKREGSGVPNE